MFLSETKFVKVKENNGGVLILVLLDVPFGIKIMKTFKINYYGLNPCFIGCSFRNETIYLEPDNIRKVLILVLLDVPFGISEQSAEGLADNKS